MKTTAAFVLGMVLVATVFICMGFSTGSNESGQLLLSNKGGGAYFYTGNKLYFIRGAVPERVDVAVGAPSSGQILVANEGGGAYFFNGMKLYFIQGTEPTYVPASY